MIPGPTLCIFALNRIANIFYAHPRRGYSSEARGSRRLTTDDLGQGWLALRTKCDSHAGHPTSWADDSREKPPPPNPAARRKPAPRVPVPPHATTSCHSLRLVRAG